MLNRLYHSKIKKYIVGENTLDSIRLTAYNKSVTNKSPTSPRKAPVMNIDRLAQVQSEEVSYDYVPTAQDLADAMEDPAREKAVDQYIDLWNRLNGQYGVRASAYDVRNLTTDEIWETCEGLYEEIQASRYF